MLKKEILIKFAVAGTVVVLPLDSWSQDDGGLVPSRLEIGDAERGGDVKVTEKGQLLPGDLGSPLPDIDLPAPDPRESIQKSLDLLPESIRNMDQSKQESIRNLLDEAANFIQGSRLQEGLDRLLRIEELTKDFYATYNLRGAIYTKLRDFDRARAAFQKALELRPGLMEAMFNLAELDFVEKKFPAAETGFRRLKDEHSSRFASHPETGKLIDYKLFISTLLQSTEPGDSKEREALAMLEDFDYLDDYPVFYYSQAALAFHQGREQDAEEWMASAGRIYSKGMQSIYIDALIEMGWVQAL